MVSQHRHTDGANGAKTERANEYILLATIEPAGDPDIAETQVCGDSYEATMGTGE